MFLDPSAICRGITLELEDTPEFVLFAVRRSVREGSLWRVQVHEISKCPSPLDESYEGAQAWWAEPAKGVGDVLAVIPEDDEIVLRDTTSQPRKRAAN